MAHNGEATRPYARRMTHAISLTARLSPTPEGKRRIALSMYAKGNAFVGAYELLHQQADNESFDYVALHNLCQGIEIVLKSLLLLHDYDKYKAKLRERPLGHDLESIARETAKVYGLRPLRAKHAEELALLNNLYKQHLLRYGSTCDILIDPRTIERNHALRRVAAVIRLSLRRIKIAGLGA